jgi:pyruvate formate lyase activating enzyme
VYVGNLPGEENTYCYKCRALLIRRDEDGIVKQHLQSDGLCPHCGAPIAGLWREEALVT